VVTRRLRPWLRAFREALLGDAPVFAAGIALFAMLATIPGLAAIVAVWGLVADPSDIAAQLGGLDRVFPREVVRFLVDQMSREAGRSSESLGVALATTLGLALYSARSTADAIMTALNYIYGVPESRHPLRTFAISLAAAATTLVGVILLAAIVVALPAVLALVRAGDDVDTLATFIRWPLLLIGITFGLSVLYRHAPSPRDHDHRVIFPGAAVATGLWLAVSLGLSIWVHLVADYQNLYGAFASVLVLILWLYLSALSVLLGGLVNAELERAQVGAAQAQR
jgi:membrane protein